ncbi:MAG: adenosine deaminase [Chloroflexota bacterium]|nr:adenosine deaminase [Chloroflexota bacterium]
MRDDDVTGPLTPGSGRMGSKDPAGISGHMSIFKAWRKAELHCHLDGAVRASTAEELATEQGLDLRRPLRLVAPEDCPSQAVYISYFDDAIAVLQTAAALERAALELCVDSAAENIDYLEVRWAPRLHLRSGLTTGEVIQAVLGGLAAAPLRAVAIVCAMRHHTVEDNIALAKEAGRFAGKGVVGFDLAGDEVLYPAAPQRPAFEAARAAGLRLTCHAGEAGDPSNVEEALELRVERIAHGVIGARDPRIVERLRSEGVVLDLCPTANWKCKAVARLAEHPLPALVRAGVRCTISTDSRTVAGTSLSREFQLASGMGLSDEELKRCNETAYAAKFG